MIFDTDVLIWALRGDDTAGNTINRVLARRMTAMSYLEIVSGVRNKNELHAFKGLIREQGFEISSSSSP